MMKKMLHNDRNYAPAGKTEICLFIFLFLAFLAFGMTPNGVSASITAEFISGYPDPGWSSWDGYHGTHYAVIIKDEKTGNYYSVHNDGSLEPATLNDDGTITLIYPLLWSYISAHDGLGVNSKSSGNPDPSIGPYNIRIAHDTRSYDNMKLPASDFYRYISPSQINGIDEEDGEIGNDTEPNHNEKKFANGLRYDESRHIVDQSCDQDGANCSTHGYYLGADFINMRLTGQITNRDEAATVLFAQVTSVPGVDTNKETVSHIDIGVEGLVDFEFPLAYGKYYKKVENDPDDPDDDTLEFLFEASKHNKVVLFLEQEIDIDENDIMGADIVALRKNGEPVQNAFYITEYETNAETPDNIVQKRLNGSFKVDILPDFEGPDANLDEDRRIARLDENNRVYYSVSITKDALFYLIDKDGNQLYDQNGTMLTTTTQVKISHVFSYWDEDNECPAVLPDYETVYWGWMDTEPGRANREWKDGYIIDVDRGQGLPPGNSGMDFLLSYDKESLAVEITKIIQDENGNQISPHPDHPITSMVNLYQNPEGDSRVVRDGYAVPPNQVSSEDIDYERGYSLLKENTPILLDTDGIGETYFYNLTRGMYYVSENQDAMTGTGENVRIIDADGYTWQYKDTHIETEYAWRNDAYSNDENIDQFHVANGYSSVPEVLGPYVDANDSPTYHDDETGEDLPLFNGFLEFYVYNVYEKVATSLTAEKIWNDNNDQDGKRSGVIATMQLYQKVGDADGMAYGEPVDVGTEDDWSNTWEDLPVYSNGTPIKYYVVETLTTANGYTKDGGDGEDTGFIASETDNLGTIRVTNSYTKERERFTFFRLPHLPETGFSAVNAAVLPKQPKDLNYKPLRWKLEIPSISVEADIVGVPKVNDEYPVAWLGSSAGLLEGSSLPGRGQSYITGHNHLNTMEAGPFAMIKYLSEGDRIFVTDPGSRMQTFEVYRNSKISETDFDGLYRISDSDENSLTLITCEDERPDGGYENRRIIAARPILRPGGE